MIDTLTEFSVIPEYQRNRTFYHVRAQHSGTVAHLRAEVPVRDLRGGLHVLAGPGLDQPAGWIGWTEAKTASGVTVGTVGRNRGRSGKDSWIFAQAGMPELTGEFAGASGALRNSRVLRDALAGHLAGGAFPLRLRFTAPGCAGFDIDRPPGLRARYRVHVHDERVSRLLVLACVVRYNIGHDIDPRKDLVRVTTDPFSAK